MITKEDIDYWQSAWSRILDMAYHRKDVVDSLSIDRKYDPLWDNFEKVTFEYMWKKYSGDVLVVPELKNLHVPYFLFSCLGSSVFLKTCFPDCEVTYW